MRWTMIYARRGVRGVWSRDRKTLYGEVRKAPGQWLAFGPGGVPLGVGVRTTKHEAAELVFLTGSA